MHTTENVHRETDAADNASLGDASLDEAAMLAEQAALLHRFFVDAIHKSMQCEDAAAAQRYGAMALKAQHYSRMAVLTLKKLREPLSAETRQEGARDPKEGSVRKTLRRQESLLSTLCPLPQAAARAVAGASDDAQTIAAAQLPVPEP